MCFLQHEKSKEDVCKQKGWENVEKPFKSLLYFSVKLSWCVKKAVMGVHPVQRGSEMMSRLELEECRSASTLHFQRKRAAHRFS